LKLIYVDSVKPAEILATTFTRKAAKALRSKIVNYGEALRERFGARADHALREWLDRIDLNGIRLGTLDSIAQDVLTEFRAANAPAPRPIEEFARTSVFVVRGVLENGLQNSANAMPALWNRLYGDNRSAGVAARAKMLKELHDRLSNDRVDASAWQAAHPNRSVPYHRGIAAALNAIGDVRQRYVDENVCDFVGLSEAFLAALESGELDVYVSTLRFILVDEYQDTNLLQESIYFALARAATAAGGSICVVGDDDQSIFRFRGATVDLFQDFPNRLSDLVGTNPRRVELINNYRSTRQVVDFVNAFVTLDPGYASGRVQPPKPPIGAQRRNTTEFPVIGIFKPDCASLARDLALFIVAVVNGPGVPITTNGETHLIQVDPVHGSPNDVALLMSQVSETKTTGSPRLPLLLRRELAALANPLQVFNPRGQELRDQPSISALLGLLLLCIDPDDAISQTVKMSNRARQALTRWRADGAARRGGSADLDVFVGHWAERRPTRRDRRRRIAQERVNINEIIYKLIAWLPELQYDIEQLALLEAITRAVVAASVFGPFDSEIIFGQVPIQGLPEASVKSAIQTILVPIAEGSIDVNEDLLETLPRNRLSILTIHQAKGLEFPVTIVDVGSDGADLRSFKDFKRYPSRPAPAHLAEDVLRPFSLMGAPARPALERAFDDLVRQFFVAYSRPQDVLVLAGVDRCIQARDAVENVATGWVRPSRGGACAWPQLAEITHWNP
jgi:DNA helicase-2/ATP-dependent DNA helicase PcrA